MKPKYGTCALTGTYGKYIKAHILPESLTKPAIPGEHFIQAGQGERPIKRWTSWYDPNLVTSEGERILANYDDWAIAELRRLNLVWSNAYSDHISASSDWNSVGQTGHGVRFVDQIDGDKLRLFLLSILWRAAASKLPELQKIRISQRHLVRIAKMLLNADPHPYYFYPACIIQLSGLGPRHNYTPLPGKKRFDNNASVRIFRFYLDGLAIHFHRDLDLGDWRSMGDLCVQGSGRIGVITVPYELSHQNEVLEREAQSAEAQWPDILARLSK